MALTFDSKLKLLVKNPGTRAVIEKYFPVDLDDPTIKIAYGMTLRKCCSFPQVEISDEDVAALEREVNEAGADA